MTDWKRVENAMTDVAEWIFHHPDHTGQIIEAIQGGIMDRLHKEIALRSNAETALILTFPETDGLSELQRQLCVKVIKNSMSYGDTPYAKKLSLEKR